MYSFFYKRHEIKCTQEELDTLFSSHPELQNRVYNGDTDSFEDELEEIFASHVCYYPTCRDIEFEDDRIAKKFMLLISLLSVTKLKPSTNDFGILYAEEDEYTINTTIIY